MCDDITAASLRRNEAVLQANRAVCDLPPFNPRPPLPPSFSSCPLLRLLYLTLLHHLLLVLSHPSPYPSVVLFSNPLAGLFIQHV